VGDPHANARSEHAGRAFKTQRLDEALEACTIMALTVRFAAVGKCAGDQLEDTGVLIKAMTAFRADPEP
jgi:predicted dinucleotide-binding enzyme